MKLRTLSSLRNLKGKRVLLRTDYNVPMKGDGKIKDDFRLRRSLLTLKFLISRGAKVVIVSHLERPEGKVVPRFRLDDVARRLSALMKKEIKYFPKVFGNDVSQYISEMPDKSIVLLENIRFYREEKENNAIFAEKLAHYADIYVNDAFGNSHRKHASMVAVTKFLPSYAGLLLCEEVRVLEELLRRPAHPFGVVIGGAKISSKLSLLAHLSGKVDDVFLGGGPANTALLSKNISIGKSLCESDMVPKLRKMRLKARLHLPIDAVVSRTLSSKSKGTVMPVEHIPKDALIGDIGPQTVADYLQKLSKMKTIVWAGPLGTFEFDAFAEGTRAVCQALAQSRAKVIVGGGETIEAVHLFSSDKNFFHVSTGGSALTQFLSGETLKALIPLTL